jgi:hypothetical protein
MTYIEKCRKMINGKVEHCRVLESPDFFCLSVGTLITVYYDHSEVGFEMCGGPSSVDF